MSNPPNRPGGVPPPPRKARVQPEPASADPHDYFGSGTFDESSLGGSAAAASLELGSGEDEAAAASTELQSYFGTGTFDPGDAENSDGAAPDLESERPVPPTPSARAVVVATAPPAEFQVDDVEVQLLADYGKPPRELYLTPVYAWRVFTRQRALRSRLSAIVQELEAADWARDAALADLATELRPTLVSDDKYGEAFEVIAHIEKRAGERSLALAQANSEYGAELVAIDAEQQSIDDRLAERRAAERPRASAVGECEHAHARADARFKRLQIEMRAVVEQAERAVGPEGGKMPADFAAKHAELKARADALTPELAQLAHAVLAAKAELISIQNQIGHLVQSGRQVQAKKAALDAQFKKQLDARSEGVAEVELEKTHALAHIGRQIVARAKRLGVYADRLPPIEKLQAAALALAKENEKYVRALDAYDRDAKTRGYIVTGAALTLLVVVLSMIAF